MRFTIPFLITIFVTLLEAAPCSIDWHGDCDCELHEFQGHRYVVISKNNDLLRVDELLSDGKVIVRFRAPKRYWI